ANRPPVPHASCRSSLPVSPTSLRASAIFLADPAPPSIYTLSLHDALPIFRSKKMQKAISRHGMLGSMGRVGACGDNAAMESMPRSEEHTSELQSRFDLVCRLLLEKTKTHDRLHGWREVRRSEHT